MAKPFRRHLPDNLIEKLNELHGRDPKSWWHRLVNCRDAKGKPDRRTFFAVRDGYLSVYTNGGSLLKITVEDGAISCQIHEEYVIQRNPDNPYVRLDGADSHRIQTIGSPDKLVEKFEQVRRRVGVFMGGERQNVGDLANRILNVIDIEATAGPSESEGRLAMPVDRTRDAIDLMAVAPDGVIWSFEAKLLANKELRAGENSVPAVVEQIRRYSQRMLVNRKPEILEAYGKVAQAYRRLEGRAFEERREFFDRVKDLRSEPVLVIFGYDRDQQQGQLKSVLRNLWKAGIRECVCMGNCSGITAAHLFTPREK